MSDRDPVYVLNHKSNNWGWFRHEITDAKGALWYGADTTKGRRQWKAENCELKAKDGTTTVQGAKVDGTTPTGPDGIVINNEDPCRRGEDTLTASVDEKKAKIARLRKIIKAECKSLRVQRGTGTAYSWVTIWANDYTRFTKEESAAMRRLDLSPCGNCSSVCPSELDATLERLEARAAASGDMVDMYRRACEKQIDASQPDHEGANMENQKAGLHEACPELAGDFSEIDAEFDDRIKEANRAKARRQAGDQAGEAKEKPMKNRELEKKMEAESELISGLLKMVAGSADEMASGDNYAYLGSLTHIRENLEGILIGFFDKGDPTEAETIERIRKRALKVADTRIVAGAKQHRIPTRGGRTTWVSIPQD